EEDDDQRVIGGGAEEVLEGGEDGGARIVAVLEHGFLDVVHEPFGLVDDEGEAELVAVAELVVESLAADPGAGGDVGHRDLRPGLDRQLVAGGVEDGLPQQLPGCLLVRGPATGHAPYRASGGDQASAEAGSKSILSRTPQSGQAQSSGTSLQGVPAGKPSRGWPACSS